MFGISFSELLLVGLIQRLTARRMGVMDKPGDT